MSGTQIHGFCDERFLAIREVFEQNFDAGVELGASFAMSVEGEMVVDLWAGSASVDGSRPWVEDTIVAVMSSSKVIVSLCGLMLIDRGLIELDAPVARYWPEFAAAGKETLPVRYLFCHSAGLPGWDVPISWKYLYDWDTAVSQLAGQKPLWEPGTKSGYHATTFGFLLGELVRRTTGKTLPQFFYDEVAKVLDVDFFIGVPMEEMPRVAEGNIDEESQQTPVPGTMWHRIQNDLFEDSSVTMSDPEWLGAEISASNGVGNARSLAKVGSILAMQGEVNGQRFLSAETSALPHQEQIYTLDLVMGTPVRFGVGFGMTSQEFPIPFPNAFHWGGYGGSSVVMIPERSASWSYTPNKFYGGMA